MALCKDRHGEWVHWGATTQDVTDTATVLQIKEALDLLEADLDGICEALAALAKKYRDTPMAGRSKLQQAVPITFGYKMASVLSAFQRHKQRLAELRARVLVGEFGGAAGTLSSLGKDGLKVHDALMDELKLGKADITWHTIRDAFGETACFLGLVTATCAKIALDVKLLMQTEVQEVSEAGKEGRGSSSTMPQKRNPISSVYITTQAAMVRQLVGGDAGSAGRGPRARQRAVGDRMGRAAGHVHAVGGCAGAYAQVWSKACRSTRRRCARTSTSPMG